LDRGPVVTVKEAQAMTGLSPNTAGDLVSAFVDKLILVETTGFQRNRRFAFAGYLELFGNG
jgi:hypothetical protein